MSKEALYVTRAIAFGGRDGRVASDDGQLDVKVVPPRELGGPGGATNPEQLFAAGFAACFHSALSLVARRAKVDVSGSTVSAEAGLIRQGVGYGLSVHLVIDLPTVPAETAAELVKTADSVCPYSNATRGNIPVTHEVR